MREYSVDIETGSEAYAIIVTANSIAEARELAEADYPEAMIYITSH